MAAATASKASAMSSGALSPDNEDYLSVLSPEVVQELTETFNHFDLNGDGIISIEELRAVLRNMGDDSADETLESMIAAVDTSGGSEIDLKGFLSLNAMAIISDESEGSPLEKECMYEAFQVFDADVDGFITASELQDALNRLGGESVTYAEAVEMIKKVDKDGDGRIDYDEFVIMMNAPCERRKTSCEARSSGRWKSL